jgi:hypothetical protein
VTPDIPSIIGADLAKQVFQLHGATAEGEVVFRKKLSRKQFLAFMPALCKRWGGRPPAASMCQGGGC